MSLLYLKLFIFMFIWSFGWTKPPNITVDQIEGKIDELITGQVSWLEQVIVSYDVGSQYLDDRTLKFDISSDQAQSSRPIVVTITSGSTIQQVKLPQTVTSSQASYSQTTVTLCLVNQTIDGDTVVIVSITAATSKEPMAFNLTAHVFENYTLSLGIDYPKVYVAPAAPVSYRYEFPPDDFDVDMVLVRVTSPDERCSVLSIQHDACPINNKEDDIKFAGYFQTFTEKAAITVPRNFYITQSFFIVIAVLSSDHDCKPTLPSIAWHISNMRPDYSNFLLQSSAKISTNDSDDTDFVPLIHAMPRQKTIYISIERIASQKDIIIAVCVTFGIFVTVYILVLSLTFTVTRRRLKRMVLEKEALCQVSPNEERSRLIRRRLMQNPQASSTPSGTIRNRGNYGAITETDVAPEVAIRTPRHLVFASQTATTNGTQYFSPAATDHGDETTIPAVVPDLDEIREDISPIGVEIDNANHNNQSAHENQEFDDTSSVDSSEYDKVPEYTYDKNLIRAKLRLYVSDLATKRPRDLVKKYALYPWNLGIISFFYALPVIQLVLAYQIAVNHLGNQDTCYYNFQCAIPVAGFSAFNNVLSNIAYILLGILFIIIVRYHDHLLKDWEFRASSGPYGTNMNTTSRRETPLVPDTPTSPMGRAGGPAAAGFAVSMRQPNVALGIPPLHGISYALGIALIMEGIMSACYHVCPNSSNFQFDTTYMFSTAWLLIAKIYQTRHPDIGRNAHLFYFSVAIIIFLAMLGAVFGVNSILFYVLLCIVMVPMTFEISLYFYFMGSFKLDAGVFYRVFYAMRHMVVSRSFKPSHPFRLVFVAVFNGLNWGLAIFGLITHPPDFDTFLLTISIANVMLYIVFYVIMKIRHRERIHPITIGLIVIATICWCSALVFFVDHNTSWQLTPAGSRNLNKPCVLFNFYDSHDVWHFLSAFALFTSFLILLVIDDEVMLTPRDKIAVF